MNKEAILNEVKDYFEQLKAFFNLAKDAPRTLWEGTGGSLAERAEMLIVMVPILAAVLYLIISFLKSGWKEKLRSLEILIISVIVLLIVFYFVFKYSGVRFA